jgi:hypothetical protein
MAHETLAIHGPFFWMRRTVRRFRLFRFFRFHFPISARFVQFDRAKSARLRSWLIPAGDGNGFAPDAIFFINRMLGFNT